MQRPASRFGRPNTINEQPRALGKNKQGVQQWGPSGVGVWGSPTLDVARKIVYVVSPKGGGGLFALQLKDGTQVWHAAPVPCPESRKGCSPGQSAAVTVIPNVVFSGSLDGHLRAYSTVDGRVVWDYDTVREFTTVNGIPGRGGAINGPGATVAGGMLFVNSGYAFFGQMPGNVLLAFGVD